jgi:hypothetical protein
MWNWSKASVCDDALFISLCIVDEILWLIIKEKVILVRGIQPKRVAHTYIYNAQKEAEMKLSCMLSNSSSRMGMGYLS